MKAIPRIFPILLTPVARRSLRIGIACACIAASISRAGGDAAPQPKLALSESPTGGLDALWQGVAGRTYFMQYSTDLKMWHYAPHVDFGAGNHQRPFDLSSTYRFIRLNYADVPGINSLTQAQAADFDADGISNQFEVSLGLHPHDASDAELDTDNDGLSTRNEFLTGRHPALADSATDPSSRQLDIFNLSQF